MANWANILSDHTGTNPEEVLGDESSWAVYGSRGELDPEPTFFLNVAGQPVPVAFTAN